MGPMTLRKKNNNQREEAMISPPAESKERGPSVHACDFPRTRRPSLVKGRERCEGPGLRATGLGPRLTDAKLTKLSVQKPTELWPAEGWFAVEHREHTDPQSLACVAATACP